MFVDINEIEALKEKEVGELIVISLETSLVKIPIQGVSILITIIVYGRIFEIYVYSAVASILFSTIAFYAQNYGYPVSRVARAGTAISFPPGVGFSSGEYGHIAFVEKVNEDGSMVISEMNVKGEFIISTRTISKEQASLCY